MYSSKALVFLALVTSFSSFAFGYSLVHNYNASNWFTTFKYHDEPDPTHGTVEYISLADAQKLGLTQIIGNRVFMGVDNTTSIPANSQNGRKSIWVTSPDEFLHGLLIGDFDHMPSSTCGLWPAFWTIRDGSGPYGEIDIVESFSDHTNNYITLHTAGDCSFTPPDTPGFQKGKLNEGRTKCSLENPGCGVIATDGSYGDPFNAAGGGVYAMDWTSDHIRVYLFPRNSIPADITAGNPDPSQWGIPQANFDSKYGGCNIDANFPPQTVYFDTTFCGAEAGGKSWTSWTDCQTKTKVDTCEEYVRTNPEAFSDAYWLVNSVKIYQ